MTESDPIPRPPRGLGGPGRKLWRAVVEPFELEPHELGVLLEAARTADLCADLQLLLTESGLTADSPQGVRVHPAVVELRQQRVTLARLLASLRIPVEDDTGRVQRRTGARGVYALGDAS